VQELQERAPIARGLCRQAVLRRVTDAGESLHVS